MQKAPSGNGTLKISGNAIAHNKPVSDEARKSHHSVSTFLFVSPSHYNNNLHRLNNIHQTSRLTSHPVTFNRLCPSTIHHPTRSTQPSVASQFSADVTQLAPLDLSFPHQEVRNIIRRSSRPLCRPRPALKCLWCRDKTTHRSRCWRTRNLGSPARCSSSK